MVQVPVQEAAVEEFPAREAVIDPEAVLARAFGRISLHVHHHYHAEPAGESAAVAGVPAATREPEPPSVAANASRRRRWYAVTRTAPGVRNLRGVHFCEWRTLAAALPGGSLVGSGCHVRGFNSVADAVAYWHAEGWTEAPRIFRA
jgi:hypothetical protein